MDSFAVKKILCDSGVAATATAVANLVSDGHLTNQRQIEALTALDEKWMHQTMAVATGDVKAIEEALA